MIERWSHEIKNYKNYSQNSFWKQCRQGNIFQTLPKQAKERNFRIKIISNELPTLETLQKRRPDLYKRKTCIQCDTQTETTNHLFECKVSVKIQEEIWNKLQEKIEVKVQKLKEKDKKILIIKKRPNARIYLNWSKNGKSSVSIQVKTE